MLFHRNFPDAFQNKPAIGHHQLKNLLAGSMFQHIVPSLAVGDENGMIPILKKISSRPRSKRSDLNLWIVRQGHYTRISYYAHNNFISSTWFPQDDSITNSLCSKEWWNCAGWLSSRFIKILLGILSSREIIPWKLSREWNLCPEICFKFTLDWVGMSARIVIRVHLAQLTIMTLKKFLSFGELLVFRAICTILKHTRTVCLFEWHSCGRRHPK